MTFWFEAPGYVVEEKSFLSREPAAGSIYMILICLIIVLGTVGNILILGAVYVSKYLKTSGNVFIISLALADLSVASFINIFNIIAVTQGEIWFTHYPRLCEFVASFCLTACYCSLYNIGAISFNRYIHICHYEYYRRIFTARNSILMAIGLWIFSALMELPNFFGWGGFGYHQRTEMCVFNYRQSVSYSLFVSLVGVGVPWLFISISYVLIFRHVYKSKKRIQAAMKNGGEESSASRSRSNNESAKLARTFFILFLAYTLCWTPFALIIVSNFADSASQTIDMFFVLMAHANSSINVLLYGVSNSHFRAGYIRFLRLDRIWSRFKQAAECNPKFSVTVKSHATAAKDEGKQPEDDKSSSEPTGTTT